MPRRRPAPAIVLAVLAGAGLAGCGTRADARQARGATQRLYTAVRHGDGHTACAQLSPDLRKKLVQDASRSCARAVLDLRLHGSRVSTVRVYATSAEAELAGGDTAFLGATKLGWRVEALGCRPEGPGPLDCQAEG